MGRNKKEGFHITSSSVEASGRLHRQCTFDNGHPDKSPAVSWHGVPEETVTLALVMEDIDEPNGFTHW